MSAVTPTLLCGGDAMDASYDLLSIDIRREVDRIPYAELRVRDGDAAQRRFAISDTGFFEPGAQIEIKLRYEGGKDKTVFKGVVVRHGVEAGPHGSILVIGLKDEAVKLTGTRKSAVFRKMKDSAIFKQLIADGGLAAGSIADTTAEHPEMVQYACTPWDFLLARADALGLLVAVEDGKISVARIEVKGSPKHQFEYGMKDILELEIEADAGHQLGAVQAAAWNPRELKPTPAKKGKAGRVAPGNLDGAKLGKALGKATHALGHPVPAAPGELQAWADGRLLRSRMALLRGRLAVPGNADIKQLDVIQVAGIGRRFNGKTLVTGLRHRYDASGWRTDVQFGIPPESFAQRAEVRDAPAAGLLPGVSGLMLGVVADFEEDPDHELRVKVLLPGIDMKKTAAVWARLASPDAGAEHGIYFRPEHKDEVVVGFLNDDPRHPVILGSLFGSKNKAPQRMGAPDSKNVQRGIVTKKGTTIGFVDGDKPSVFIETAKKNRLLLDDEKGEIRLSDQHGNSITMGKDGIVLKSAKKLTIDAAKDVAIKGSKVDIK